MDAKKILLDEIKKQGLDIAEDAVMGLVKAILEALPKYFMASENKYDDMLIAVLPVITPFIMKELDKIDGEKDLA